MDIPVLSTTFFGGLTSAPWSNRHATGGTCHGDLKTSCSDPSFVDAIELLRLTEQVVRDIVVVVVVVGCLLLLLLLLLMLLLLWLWLLVVGCRWLVGCSLLVVGCCSPPSHYVFLYLVVASYLPKFSQRSNDKTSMAGRCRQWSVLCHNFPPTSRTFSAASRGQSDSGRFCYLGWLISHDGSMYGIYIYLHSA